jgi:hypothetical protein
MDSIQFPTVSGRNLQRESLQFPQDFPAKYTIVLMAFWRHQQNDVDTWLPYANVLEKLYLGTAYVEFPVIWQMSSVRQFLLNEGMRAGIPDQKSRQRTTTLYLDKSRFFSKLQIASQDKIQVLLVRDDGQVLWRETGRFSPEKGKSLSQALQAETDLKYVDPIL